MSSALQIRDCEKGRRWFLIRASLAATAGLAMLNETLNPPRAEAQTTEPIAGGVQTFTAAGLQNVFANLEANPGNHTIVDDKTFTVALTIERDKSQEEFEWHENRDHIFQIIAGSTAIEVGGKPKRAHSSKAGEWNAPESENAVKIVLNKGDMLVIPRGVPHKRTTTGSVTLTLISPQGSA
jgi:mannose-6-phosphate isomerase-like protein (cupin superfamily)